MEKMKVDRKLAVALWYYSRQRHRRNKYGIIAQLELATRLSHLQVYTFSTSRALFQFFKTRCYFVENTITRKYYEAPKYIGKLAANGIISLTNCENEEEMRLILAANGSHENEEKPSMLELMEGSGKP